MWRNIEHLIPYARNARTHSDAQIAKIGANRHLISVESGR